MHFQKVISKKSVEKISFMLASWRSMTKIAGSESGSNSQRHGYQNVMDPQHWFPEKELHGISSNFHIDVYVGDLNIPSISPYTVDGKIVNLFLQCIVFSCSRIGRPTVEIYKSLTDTWMWKLGLRQHNFFPGNIYFEFSVLGLTYKY